ncbi:MAG TPA: hypothetical protein VI796_00785, partial [Candidatus Thermoplasmatota archaeon]|nr:hypothetical protein [Candidatus Thermoplasmatota archaeon]
MRIGLVAVLLALSALAGCSDKGGSGGDEQIVPREITEDDVDRLEELVTADPRAFSFPGQTELEPFLLLINETVPAGTGVGASEMPNDDGVTDTGGAIIPFDLSEHVPVGQPVEVRIKLKWYGNPGSSADLDIYVNVPGTHDAYAADSRYDESINWNIINKVRVVDTVHVEGQPFEVGLQVTNGKDIHPDGIPYTLRIELVFPTNVVAPGIVYGITVPPGASGLIFDSEPVTGDEHIASEVVVVDPDNLLAVHFTHNDIVTETLFRPVTKPGEYMLYVPNVHGGFLRVSTDVPNPTFQARVLESAWTESILASGPVASPAVPGLSVGGTFDTAGAFPLDLVPFVRPVSGSGSLSAQASLNISSSDGWVATAETTATINDADGGRIGTSGAVATDRSHLAVGTYD